MLSKYPSSAKDDQNNGTYLSLEGFLAYYRDCVQSNEMRLREDLHTFGFRPDLSRRSREARFSCDDDKERLRPAAESVAIDVAETFKEKTLDLGDFASVALASIVYLHSTAHGINPPLMQYLLAGAAYKRDTEPLINRTLQAIYQTPTDWGGNDIVSAYTMILHVLASVPGEN
jgi:hypothetical protein